MARLPKVLVFTVTYEGKDYALEQFLEHANKLTYPNMRHIFIDNSKKDKYFRKLLSLGLDAYRVDRGNNSREAIARAQNLARQIAIDEGYDYLFSLESDIMAPPDIIQDLMKSGTDVITGLYFIGDKTKGVRVPCITLPKYIEEGAYFGTRLLTQEELPNYVRNGVQRVQAGGMGCCLIYRSVFEKIRFIYEIGLKGHSDIYFFNDCFGKNVPVFVDTDIVCDHENVPWTLVEDR